LALLSEIVAGEIGRRLGLRVPEIVFVEVDEALGRNEPDYEIRQLLTASAGLNVGLDYLPGSIMYNPAARDRVDPSIASIAVWFDAYVTNIDRTARNPNLLCWHRDLYFIDHGAALYFQHNWQNPLEIAASKFARIQEHVLLPWASALEALDSGLRALLREDWLRELLEMVPDRWLPDGATKGEYVEYLSRRRDSSAAFVEEALRARAGRI
jgi:hypothetical protein